MSEKDFYFPESDPQLGDETDWEINGTDEATPDPYDLFDRCAEQADEAPYLWPPFGVPAEPCPCCGADIPANPSPGYICPICWWEIDPFVGDAEEPSDLNHGLTLTEARMNFCAFGICAPWLRQEEN